MKINAIHQEVDRDQMDQLLVLQVDSAHKGYIFETKYNCLGMKDMLLCCEQPAEQQPYFAVTTTAAAMVLQTRRTCLCEKELAHVMDLCGQINDDDCRIDTIDEGLLRLSAPTPEGATA